MLATTKRAHQLNPANFLKLAENILKQHPQDEPTHRKLASALYYAIFNYWSALKHDQGIPGKGPKQDSYPYKQFHQELLQKALDSQLILIYTLRVTADHYTLNPTTIKLYNLQKQLETQITHQIIHQALKAAHEILQALHQKQP